MHSCTEAVQLRSQVEKLTDDLEQTRTEANALRDATTLARSEAEKLKEAARVKDDEVAFLRGHDSQLTQSISQLALPPTQEEAKKKGWWQFRRR